MRQGDDGVDPPAQPGGAPRTRSGSGRAVLLSDIVHDSARKRPSHHALVDDERAYTYAELSARVTRLASALSRIVRPGDRVAVLADNCVEYIELLYAAPQIGAIVTMVNQRLTEPEVDYVLATAEPTVLLVGASHLERIGDLPQRRGVRTVVCVGGEPPAGAIGYDAFAATGDGELLPRPSDEDTAWLIFTSGTTGRPKGAMLSHRNVVASILNAMLEWRATRDDRNLFCFPLCHVAAFVPLGYHLCQATVILMGGFHPGRWLELVERHRATHVGLAPTMLRMVLDHPAAEATRSDSIELVVYGGAAISPTLLAQGIERFGHVFCGTFGQTEASGNVLALDRSDHRRAAAGESHLLSAAGRCECLAAVRIVDDAMADRPAGEVGEVVIRGDQVMQGYWRNPQATAEAIVDGWLRTGDLARIDDEGYVFIVDRKKDMVVSGGENVFPREVEDVISRLEGVREVAVIGVPDELWGELVVAVVATAPDATLDEPAVIAHCRKSLAGYKVPKRVDFREELPKNAAMKILKRVLRDEHAGAPAA